MSGAFEGERVVVIGLGVAGVSAARVLAAESASVLVTEVAAEPPAAVELRAEGIEVRTGGHAPEHLDGATLVVVSPGVPPRTPVMTWAAERGLPVWGEMELGARLARVPYLAVTGTNGKTTTTGMLTACLRAAGVDAVGPKLGSGGQPRPRLGHPDFGALGREHPRRGRPRDPGADDDDMLPREDAAHPRPPRAMKSV